MLVDGERGGQEPPARRRRGDRAARRAGGARASRNPIPTIPVVVRYEDADVRRGRQARRPRRAPGRRSPRRHARERPPRALPGARRRRRPGAPGHRAPARPRHERAARGRALAARRTTRSSRMLAAHDVERALRRAGVGHPDVAARGDRRADRPLGAPPDAHGGARGRSRRARTAYEVRAEYREPERVAARVPARDRPHPPDPRAPPGDRPPGGRRRRLRRARVRRSTLDRPFLHAGGAGVRAPGDRGAGAGRGAARADELVDVLEPARGCADASVVGVGVAPAGSWSTGVRRAGIGRAPGPSPRAACRAVRRGSRAGSTPNRPKLAPRPTVVANAVIAHRPGGRQQSASLHAARPCTSAAPA